MTINIETLRFEIQLNKLDNSQMVLSPLVVGELLSRFEAVEKERDELRAEVAEMERQEPVAKVESWTNGSRTGGQAMTRDDVIRMAREADPGFEGGADSDGTMPDSIVGVDQVLKFAHLVAAAEREACAQLVEKNADVCGPNTMLCDVLRGNAAAIRARCCDAP